MNRAKLQFFVIAITNLIPAAGVTLWQWNVFQIIFLYWLESAIVGFCAVAELSTLEDSIGLFDLTDPPSKGNILSFIFIYFPILIVYLCWVTKVLSGQPSVSVIEAIQPYAPQVFIYALVFALSHYLRYSSFKAHADKSDLSALGYFLSPFARLLFVHLLLLTSVYWIYFRHVSTFYFIVTYCIKLSIDFGFRWWHEAHIPKVIKDRDFFGL